MLRWLDLQAAAFPKASVRLQAKALRTRLANRPRWGRSNYEAAVKAQGFSIAPPADKSWRWCDMSNGRGGYSCALWTLFHTTLANVARPNAAEALRTIALWVNDFFGCDECARHFLQYYDAHRGHDVGGGQIGAVLWLWRAHNAVTSRLRDEELRADGSPSERPARFPLDADCVDCFNETAADGSTDHSIFEYLQEVYCFESDTYAHAQPAHEQCTACAHTPRPPALLLRTPTHGHSFQPCRHPPWRAGATS